MRVQNLSDLLSVGQLAGEVRFSVASIERAARQLGIRPALRIDRVAHFDAAAVERITAALRGAAGEVESVK